MTILATLPHIAYRNYSI